MNSTTIRLIDVGLSFPQHRVGLGSVLRWIKRSFGIDAKVEPFIALKQINLEIKRGEVIGILEETVAEKYATPSNFGNIR